MEDTLQCQLVPLEGSDRFPEHFLEATRRTTFHTRDVDLLPINGHVVGLENSLDTLSYLGTNTVTGNEGNSVFAAILRRLENVGLDRRKRSRSILDVRLLTVGCSRQALREKSVSRIIIIVLPKKEHVKGGGKLEPLGWANWRHMYSVRTWAALAEFRDNIVG